jgi:hypothetical protein
MSLTAAGKQWLSRGTLGANPKTAARDLAQATAQLRESGIRDGDSANFFG